MIKFNPSDGYGDEQKFASSGKAPLSWPKSSNWNDRIQLTEESHHELSQYIENSLATLEEAMEEFVTTNSRRSEIRKNRS